MFEFLYNLFYAEEEEDPKDPKLIHQKYLVTKAINNNNIKLSSVRKRVDAPVIKRGSKFVKSYKKKSMPVDIL